MQGDPNRVIRSSPATEEAPRVETAGSRTLPGYALVTPARNEADFIEETIRCVIAQTLPPLRWVIVSDGSTDGTDEIVKKYALQHDWIVWVRLSDRQERHFAGKVFAFNAGYERLKDVPYDVLGNLDADITFGEDYFAFLMEKFAANSKLGVAGTPFQEEGKQYDYRFTSIEHVSGACQMFRRDCFEAIGGYKPVKIGGVDLVAVLTARMKGWMTRSFPERICQHHRKMGTAKQGRLMVAFRGGRGDYMLGGHPLWELFRCIYQMSRPPLVAGGLYRLAGYTWAMATRTELAVTRELMRFRRGEQMIRLKQFFRRVLSFGKRSAVGGAVSDG